MDNFSQNKEQIIQYLAEGCKTTDTPMHFGVELEHFVVYEDTKEAVAYLGEHGVEAILKELMPFYEECVYSEGHLIALGREGIALSLEPAAQLEVSISPQQSIDGIQEIYERFYNEISPILENYSYALITTGYQPKSKVEELELLPKARYRFMDRYFAKIGPYGRQMMRGTAATQVSIDYYSEEDFKKKYRVAYRLKDVIARFFSNSPIYEGNAYSGCSLRNEIWTKTDNRRVDVEPFWAEDGTLSFADYAEFVMQTPVIVNKADSQEFYDERTIGEIAAEHIFSKEEIVHVLSMVFPMIRAKHFLELRFLDSIPIGKVLTYVLLLKGLFTDIEYTEKWVFSEKFDKMGHREQMMYIVEQIQSRVSADENEYLKDNCIW